ncbi:hypothetical protein [Streptomyces physcomitrii]|uniref:hypothetical protein n=1 Tax=Streptomyces physcomitrii TaxID=2724184 RepID=UPI003F4CE9A1
MTHTTDNALPQRVPPRGRRARRFYEQAGFRPDGSEQTDPVGGEPVTEVRYGLRLG